MWGLVWICLAGLATPRAAALEVEHDLGESAAPSLGIYQVQYLDTAVNTDANLTRGYHAIVKLDFPAAVAPLRECLATRTDDPKLSSEAATLLGYAFMNMRQASDAVDAFQLALRLNPQNDVAHFFLAQEYFIENKRDLEKANLEAAVRIHPDFTNALRMLAETAKEDGRGRDAIELYSRIVKYLPNSGYYRYQLYRACMDASDYKQAEEALKELMRIEPAFVINHYRLGEVYLLQGRVDEARSEYQKLEDEPTFRYLANTGYAKVAQARHDLVAALQYARQADQEAHGTYQEATSLLVRIKVEQREQALQRTRQVLSWGGIGLLIALAVFFARSSSRRKYVLSEIHKLNDEVGRIHDQDELCAFLLGYFCPLMGSDRGLVLLHNRFTNQLTTSAVRNVEGEESVKVLTGGDLSLWAEYERRPMLRVADLTGNAEFERLFPSLAERLKRSRIEWLLLLRERDFFLGFLAIGAPQAGKSQPPSSDLLAPLLRAAAKAMEAVILYETSMVDETTGLYNKRYFKQALATELKRADRYQQPCTIITFDLDDFKKINDTYGHNQGDLVLKGIGDILRRNIREGIDTVARTGGEEFHLILPATSADRAVILAERVRSSIAEHRFEGFSKPVKVTVSLGVGTYPTHATEEQTLLQIVDDAQYKAKRGGKNRVVVVEAREPEKHQDRSFVPVVENRIDNLNIIDNPTGLFNFTYFSMRLREEFRRSGRYPTPVSLLVLHVDGEHEDGSRLGLLKQLGVLVRESLREGIDTPTRLETGELAIIVPETSPEAVSKLGARLMELAASHRFAPNNRGITVSIGISGYPTLGQQANDVLESAVQAARKMHEMGGNGIVIAPPSSTADAEPPHTEEETPIAN